jgi:hypothetical protein
VIQKRKIEYKQRKGAQENIVAQADHEEEHISSTR